MKIVIIGAGGVGGYFGAKLADAGFDITFIARGKHKKAIQENGLKVNSFKGNLHVFPKCTASYSSVKNADLILLCVKAWQLEEVANAINIHVSSKAVILPLQNGADNAQRLSAILGDEKVLAGLCRIVSKIKAPGLIMHFGYEPEIVFGEVNNLDSQRTKNLKKVFDQAGFKSRISNNIQRDIWLKFLFIASISGIGALSRSVLGMIRKDPFLRKKISETALEIVSVGIQLGIDISEDDIESTFKVIDRQNFDTTMSMQRDMMQGKPSELENFNGFISSMGEKLNIPTPTNDFIYHSLKLMEEQARSES